MNLSLSNAIALVKPLDPTGIAGAAAPGVGEDFKSVIGGVIGDVKSTQAESGAKVASWMNGEDVDIHQVAMSVQKAGLTFEIAMEMRNKVMQAYQEVMRMQI